MMLADLPPGVLLIWAGLLGLVVGSFLNVLILRLPERMRGELRLSCRELAGESVEWPRERWFGLDYLIHPPSTCPHCGHTIRAWENIPIASWLWLRGRCSACSHAISPRYPLIETLTGILTLIVVWQFGATGTSLAYLVLVWGLIALAVIDLDQQLLPDQLTLPLLWLGLLVNMANGHVRLDDALLGAVLGYCSLWLVFHLFRLVTGKEGMGYGDFKLLALFGAWFGWQMLAQIILLSSLIGAIVGGSLILLRGHDRQIPIPFGPYLAAAGLISLFWGERLNALYLQFAGLS